MLKTLVTFALLAGATAGVVLFFFQEKHEVPTDRASITSTKGDTSSELVEVPSLTSKNKQASNVSERYTVDIDYPEVRSSTHPELAREANAVIEAFVEDTISTFTENVREMYTPNVPREFSSDLTMNWTPLLVSPTLLSLRFESSAYIAGAAHPDNRTRVLNYDLPNHRLLTPTDCFASSTQALTFLSRFSREVLRTKMANEPEELFLTQAIPGTEPTYEHFQEIGITTDGLVIIFNPYQVAPYARGTVEVPIPFEILQYATDSPGISQKVEEAIRLSIENFQEATREE